MLNADVSYDESEDESYNYDIAMEITFDYSNESEDCVEE